MEFVALVFDCMGMGLVDESSVAVWAGDVSLTLFALAYCVGSNARRCLDTRAQFGW